MLHRKLFIVLGLLALLSLALAGCGPLAPVGGGAVAQRSPLSSASPTSTEQPRTVSVSGTGVAGTKPDVVFIELGVESLDPDPAKAIEDNTTRMTAVVAALKEMGLLEKDVQTVNYSMAIESLPLKEGQPPAEMRYHVINRVRVKLRDLAKAGELLSKTLKAGANNVGGITFTVADPSALQKEARDKAIANARAKAEQLATGLGMKVGTLRQVSEWTSEVAAGPLNRGEVMTLNSVGPVPVSAGELNVTVQIQVVFDLVQ